MNDDSQATPPAKPKGKRSPHELDELFKAARYVPVPIPFLVPAYLRQVGSDGLAFIVALCFAYQQARHRHRLIDGRLALPDQHIAEWWGFKTTAAVRKARAKVLKASPTFLDDYWEGASGLPSEYQIRRLSEADRLPSDDIPTECVGMSLRRRASPHDSGEMTEIALEYVIERRFSVFPVRGKTPCVKWKEYQTRLPTPDEIRRWYRQWPHAGIGLATGALSGVVVVDIDGDHAAGLELLRKHGVELPPTGTVTTGRGGVHLWYAHPGGGVPTDKKIVTDGKLQIDLRGDGGFAVAPPTVHANGRQYRFTQPLPRTLPVLPAEFLRLVQERKQKLAARPKRAPNPQLNASVAATLAEVSIVRVIQDHGVALEKEAPDRYRALCPFHLDTTPSFVVTPSKGLFHCFGCEAAGNAIQFVQKKRGVGFAEAMRVVRAS